MNLVNKLGEGGIKCVGGLQCILLLFCNKFIKIIKEHECSYDITLL